MSGLSGLRGRVGKRKRWAPPQPETGWGWAGGRVAPQQPWKQLGAGVLLDTCGQWGVGRRMGTESSCWLRPLGLNGVKRGTQQVPL